MRAAALVLVAGIAGCAERTWIRTSPPGASVWVNDRMVGISPVVYSVSQRAFAEPQRYRIELPGYETAEGELVKRTSPARIVGALFSLGLSFLFKPPTSFADRHSIALQLSAEPATRAERPSSGGQEPPRGTTVTPTTGPKPTQGALMGAPGGDMESRLRRLKEARERGLITEEEYRRTRARILEEL